MSDAERRVRAALSFQPPDRVPRYDSFWPEFTDNWRQQKALGPDSSRGLRHRPDLVAADETPAVAAEGGGTDGDETVS